MFINHLNLIIEFAVCLLENDELFNAEKGAVLTNTGYVECEASIMIGEMPNNLITKGQAIIKCCGSASMINKIKNPISVARLVMEKTDHVYIVGEEVQKLAKDNGLEIVDKSYYLTEHRMKQWNELQGKAGAFVDHSIPTESSADTMKNDSKGTVGCVCLYKGILGAATSTGGLINKMNGRVGDTPIIGAGTYADNDYAALSATGKSEEFIRYCATYDVIGRMKYGGQTLDEAMKSTVMETLPEGSGGLIGVDKHGNYSMQFNSVGMYRGVYDGRTNTAFIGIWNEMYPIQLT